MVASVIHSCLVGFNGPETVVQDVLVLVGVSLEIWSLFGENAATVSSQMKYGIVQKEC